MLSLCAIRTEMAPSGRAPPLRRRLLAGYVSEKLSVHVGAGEVGHADEDFVREEPRFGSHLTSRVRAHTGASGSTMRCCADGTIKS